MLAKVTGLHTSGGGVPKLPVEVLEITTNGCIGDSQNDLKHHGGVEKAVCIFQQEIINELNQHGHPISPGTCLLYTSPSPRDKRQSRMPSSA